MQSGSSVSGGSSEEELESILQRIMSGIMEGRGEESEEDQCCPIGKSITGVVETPSPSYLRKILSSCRVVVMTFYTPVCPYCKLLEPVFYRLAEVYGGRVVFLRVNAFEQPMLAQQLMVFSVPQTIIFVNGKPRTRIPGLIDEDHLATIIDRHLKTAGCAG